MWRSVELWLAVAAIAALTAGYSRASAADLPGPASLAGHSIGIAGFVLMLATQTLYSLRKRALSRPLGPTRRWLQLHVFTGLVGPYMVLLHTGWQNDGLAGAVAWITVVMVVSGFAGRYLYTAVPRIPQVEVEAEPGGAALRATRRVGALWYVFHVPLGIALFVLAAIHVVAAVYYATLLR